MTCKCVSIALATAFFSTLCASAPSSAQAGRCSMRSGAGNYGFTLTGVVILPTGAVPIAAVGRATVDADGGVSGTESRTVGDGFAEETLAGTFVVNPDCTGTITLKFYESGQLVRTSTLTTVTDDDSKEIRMVQKSLVLPNGASVPVVITVEARKIFSRDQED